ncbi:N-terminal nucleophile aminohydrolases [Mycena indigotica]|uniref:N-terminal nucleophile aminohydrolases n=1 Tax=Mycena indigotica TaxID=2126181 RepID=A0A8H6S4K4_9AGAR|nr:N-terminal nucleophile aminohydrolases [Mycena indigotica]KAF7292223.1 N-terminal nucleophile aminohydrolases [Mycena indigotica]
MAAYFQAPTAYSRTALPPLAAVSAPQHLVPPSDTSGTIMAITGVGFTVIAGDARRGDAFGAYPQVRFVPTVFRLTDKAVLATNGFASDGNIFIKKVRQRLDWYRHAHAKDMSLHAIALLIQSMLYQRRFCPFYVHNILGGIEDDGSGAVYSFDEVGSYVRETCRAAGSASTMLQPFLDSQIYPKSSQPPTPGSATHLSLARVLALVMDSYKHAADRLSHDQIGDGLEVYIVLSKGTSTQGLNIEGVSEVTSIPGGERIFLLRRSLA